MEFYSRCGSVVSHGYMSHMRTPQRLCSVIGIILGFFLAFFGVLLTLHIDGGFNHTVFIGEALEGSSLLKTKLNYLLLEFRFVDF